MQDLLRHDLLAAMKARDAAAVAALRSALAVLENAGAVPVAGAPAGPRPGSAHIAGAAVGVGATEALRRDLDVVEMLGLLAAERDRLTDAARHAETAGRADVAERCRAEAAVLGRYLPA